MNQYGVIYLLTFVKENIPDYYYVGKTTVPINHRIYRHLHCAWKLRSDGSFEYIHRVAREIRNYEIKDTKTDIIWDENVPNSNAKNTYLKVNIIDTAQSEEELSKKEKTYIRDYNSYQFFYNSDGFNSTLGGDGISAGVFNGEKSPVAQLTNYQAKQVRLLNRDTSLTYGELADLFDCSLGCIHHIVYNNTYKDSLINESDVLDEYVHWINYAPLSRRKRSLFYSYDLRESDIEKRVQIWDSNVKCAAELGDGVDKQKISYALGGKRGIVAKHFAFVRSENNYEFEMKQLPVLQEKHDKQFRSFSAYDKKTGELVGTFNCMAACIKKLQLKNTAPVYKCLKNQTSHNGNFIFIYDDKYSPNLLKERMELANPRAFYMFQVAGTKIGGSWTIIKACAERYVIDETNIGRCLKSQKPYKNKYIFLYVDQYTDKLLKSIIENIYSKECYLLFDLQGECIGVSNSQYDLCHTQKIYTASYALKTKNYYIPSKSLIIIPESEFTEQILIATIKKAKQANNKYMESQTNCNKIIEIYTKDKFIAEFPNTKAAIQSGIVPSDAIYRVPKSLNKIYKGKLIIIYKKDVTPSYLNELRKKLKE